MVLFFLLKNLLKTCYRDAFQYIKHSIQSNECITSLKSKYNGNLFKGAAITNINEIPKDISNEVRESSMFEGVSFL